MASAPPPAHIWSTDANLHDTVLDDMLVENSYTVISEHVLAPQSKECQPRESMAPDINALILVIKTACGRKI